MKTSRDKKGMLLMVGDPVAVPTPSQTDTHSQEFVGSVVEFGDDDIVTVADQSGNCFDIEAYRLEVA